MVTEDIASTSDEALHHHQPSEKEGEKEDAQHSEKETGTEKNCMTTPFSLVSFAQLASFFLQLYFHFRFAQNTCFRQFLV